MSYTGFHKIYFHRTFSGRPSVRNKFLQKMVGSPILFPNFAPDLQHYNISTLGTNCAVSICSHAMLHNGDVIFYHDELVIGSQKCANACNVTLYHIELVILSQECAKACDVILYHSELVIWSQKCANACDVILYHIELVIWSQKCAKACDVILYHVKLVQLL